ncbi:MAG: hypothetical protein WCJ33_03680 [Pseudomonadota bacterium]
MVTVVIPHRDPTKEGAQEHVDAIIKSLKALDDNIVISQSVNDEYKDDKKNIIGQIESIRSLYDFETSFIVVTSYYAGMDAVIFKKILGESKTKAVLSSYTAHQSHVMEALDKQEVDFLALPKHAIEDEVINGSYAEKPIKNNIVRIIEMIGVPQLIDNAMLKEKYAEWNKIATLGKIPKLPSINKENKLIVIMIPGDTEDKDDKPILFEPDEAVKLVEAIYKNAIINSKNTLFMVSNSPRTGKYRDIYNPEFNSLNPRFHNQDRKNGSENNPVAKAAITRLIKLAGAENVIDGCIAKDKIPPQGFLAFYELLNKQSQAGGKVEIYIDGISTTMMSQAINVSDYSVAIIACDSPAKNSTHIACYNDFFARGYIDKLELTNGKYSFIKNPVARNIANRFDDARIIAKKIVSIM